MTPELSQVLDELSVKRSNLLEELRARPGGLAWCERHTDVADEVVRAVFQASFAGREGLPPVAIVATGGYGRREMAPHSDIDLAVVPGDERSEALDEAIRHLFQHLHWAFGTVLRMQVGYAYRPIGDAPGLDAKSRTGLLDMRLVAGSSELFHTFDEALKESFSPGEFLLAKLTERKEMHERTHDTPLVVEPQLKEGAGGLRDFHAANWLREAIGERTSRPTLAYDALVRMRNMLHLSAGKPQDLLTRSRQAEIAEQLGLDVFVMMSEHAKAASEVHHGFQITRERLAEARFDLSSGTVVVRGEARILPGADAGEAAVGIGIATRLGLSVSDLPIQVLPTERGPAALHALSDGEPTLRNLDRCGLLGALLPELVACRTLMPHDSIHAYTVFEHTMRVVRNLDAIEPGTFHDTLRNSITDLGVLYLAALLHDVGKIDLDRHHSETSAEMAAEVATRWSLADGLAEKVEWLVREHLTMARFIRMRDIAHPETIEAFGKVVGDEDRLAMLTLLTWADVSAVTEGAWTPSQDTFLRQLYEQTKSLLQGSSTHGPDVSQSRARLLRQLRTQETNADEIQSFLESLPAYYLLSTPSDLVRVHMELVSRAVRGEPTVEQFQRVDLGATDLTICTRDASGLLGRLLGVIYAYDLSVLAIRACTTTGDQPVALDTFTVAFNGRPVPRATANNVVRSLLEIVRGELTVEDLLRSRGKDPDRDQRLFRYTFLPGTPGILEIRAPRGRGMPYRFSSLLSRQGWNIVSARVGQWAGSAAAAFYVTGPGGEPLTQEQVELALEGST